MKQNLEEKNYQAKLRGLSDEAFSLVMMCFGSDKQIEEQHKIVMESKTEEELVQKLEALLKSSPN